MSLAFTVELRGNLTAGIGAKTAKLQPQKVARIISEPNRIFWRDRLKSLGPNKRGWPSTGFWQASARAVTATVVPEGLLLACKKIGPRQRWLGGPIKPVRKKALAIPISPASYGHSPGEFPGLFVVRTSKGAFLVQKTAAGTAAQFGGRVIKSAFRSGTKALGGNARRRLLAGLNFLFKLSPGVVQGPNPDVVPTADEFLEVSLAAIANQLLKN
jgi:hypothetical protein